MTAIAGQDNLRRIVLRERDVPGGAGGIEDVIAAASTLDATVGASFVISGCPCPALLPRLCRVAKRQRLPPAPLPLHAWRCVRSIRLTRLPAALSP
jgi:hypothetical protein